MFPAYLFNLVYYPTTTTYHKNIGKGVGVMITRFLLPDTVRKITIKTWYLEFGSCTQHAVSNSLQPYLVSSIYLKGCRELSRSQGFYYQLLSGEITKSRGTELWFLYVTCFLNLVYNLSIIDIPKTVLELSRSQVSITKDSQGEITKNCGT